MGNSYGFFCGRDDCRGNKNRECAILVRKNPITGDPICQTTCPFYQTQETFEKDKEETLAKLRAKGREDLIKKYWGVYKP